MNFNWKGYDFNGKGDVALQKHQSILDSTEEVRNKKSCRLME